eukprot:gb/GEZN01008478.1/.p1 GENE.gb/GEZN01008478.1/~~gb/GEZN01008478.1/.p1  ORF type:complete len:397 (+),score=75.20 gb/GEZN01008478.1/:158-1192(+)
MAKMVALNCQSSHLFQTDVNMYVYEETVNGKKLSEIINTQHENVKYLPGVKLPPNLKAVTNIKDTVDGAHLLVFVQPHQFIERSCSEIQKNCKIPDGAKAISLVKGFGAIDEGRGGLKLVSKIITDSLGIECCALSGANVAKELGRDEFAETTIGYEDQETGGIFQQLFDRPYFKVNCVRGVAPIEICGALKNVVALAAGFADGLKLGNNTKAALIRLGLLEMRQFCYTFYSKETPNDDAFWDSCGVADLITTCYGGRNRKCAEVFVTMGGGWDAIEKKLLNGQKLQGTLTAIDVAGFLQSKNALDDFPFFQTVFHVVVGKIPPAAVVNKFMLPEPRRIPKAKL